MSDGRPPEPRDAPPAGADAAGAARRATAERIDPEVARGLETFFALAGPGGFNATADLDERRALYAEITRRLGAGRAPEGVRREDREAPRPDVAPDGPPVPVRVYRPSTAAPGETLPGVCFVHGGGMIIGSVQTADATAAALCEAVGCVLVSVDYRLAPEHPHPAPVEDCFAVLRWMADAGAELGVDPDRLAVYGPSAGGGLAAGTALLARERGGPALALQALIYPMLDDRSATPSSREVRDLGIWDREANLEGWRCLLGDRAGGPDVPSAAAPARERDLAGLPPTYVDVGELDLFRDEDVDYAVRLLRAGVPTELHVYPGAVHAAESFAPDTELARRVVGYRVAALRRALHGAA